MELVGAQSENSQAPTSKILVTALAVRVAASARNINRGLQGLKQYFQIFSLLDELISRRNNF